MIVNRIDPDELTLRQLCNVVWHRLVDGATKDQIEQIEAQMMRPIPGQEHRVSQAVVDAEMGMFRRAIARTS